MNEAIETVGKIVDLAGVGVIILGIILATFNFVRNLSRSSAYSEYRKGLGQGLLLGLELLVAADIIRTVAIAPTLDSVIVLAVIVAIRTFLSWSLEVEIHGKWPWQSRTERGEKGALSPED